MKTLKTFISISLICFGALSSADPADIQEIVAAYRSSNKKATFVIVKSSLGSVALLVKVNGETAYRQLETTTAIGFTNISRTVDLTSFIRFYSPFKLAKDANEPTSLVIAQHNGHAVLGDSAGMDRLGNLKGEEKLEVLSDNSTRQILKNLKDGSSKIEWREGGTVTPVAVLSDGNPTRHQYFMILRTQDRLERPREEVYTRIPEAFGDSLINLTALPLTQVEQVGRQYIYSFKTGGDNLVSKISIELTADGYLNSAYASVGGLPVVNLAPLNSNRAYSEVRIPLGDTLAAADIEVQISHTHTRLMSPELPVQMVGLNIIDWQTNPWANNRSGGNACNFSLGGTGPASFIPEDWNK